MCEEKANVRGAICEYLDPESEDTLLFLLQDSKHRFTIGLSDVLRCLKFAETEGEVPEIPTEWWLQMQARYPFLEWMEKETDEKI